MKKTISVLLSVVISLSCMGLGIVANAATPWIDNKETGEFYWNERLGDWEFLQVSANSVCITKYYGNAESLDVPSKINGLEVSEIGDNAFDSNTAIKKAVLPSSIVKIGLGAFENCKNLNSVAVPDSVRRICSMVFGAISAKEGSYESKPFVLYGSESSVAKHYCEAQEVDNQSYRAPSFVLI